METPIVTISVIDDQTMRQDEAREAYLKWLSENDSRLAVTHHETPLKLTPTRENVSSGW